MAVEIPLRQSSPLPPGAKVMSRQARPLTGLEIGGALREGTLRVAQRLCGQLGLDSEETIAHLEMLGQQINNRLATQTVLQKTHLVFPHVGWRLRVNAECLADDKGWNLWCEVELDLERNRRIVMDFGVRGQGTIGQSDEEEQLSTDKPDDLRYAVGLKAQVDYVMPSGEVGKTEIDGSASDVGGEKRVARSVDLSRSAPAVSNEPLVVVERQELPEADLVGEPPLVEKSEPVGLTVGGAGGPGGKPRAQLKRGGK